MPFARFPAAVRIALWLYPILTLSLAVAIPLAFRWLFAATGQAMFWERGTGPIVAYVLPFAAGSVLFCLGPFPLLRLAPVVPRDQRRLILWMGITFAAWGSVLAALTACSLGCFCALMCAIVLHHASRSVWMAILPIALLAPAWGIALGSGNFAGNEQFVHTGTVAVSAWNVLMAIALAVWVVVLRRNLPFDGECPECRYDRRDLPGHAPCPECGTLQPRVEAGAWPDARRPSPIVRKRP